MLERRDETESIAAAWDAAESRVEISEDKWAQLYPQGNAQIHLPENQRAYHRHLSRSKVLVQRGNTVLGCIVKDVSRQGAGFYCPIQLFPLELVTIRFPNEMEFVLEVMRCRRVYPNCYHCGGRFRLRTSGMTSAALPCVDNRPAEQF